MNIHFATCERGRALQYLKKVYPNRDITDSVECAGLLLDFVANDIVRIRDPYMHGNRIAVIPGNNWDEKYRKDVENAAEALTGEKGE